MNIANSIIIGLQTAAYQYWDGLDQKLSGVGEAVNELLSLCQKYWFIPLIIIFIAVAGLIIYGKDGRKQAKGIAFWALVSVIVVMSIPTIVGLFMTFFAPDAAYQSTLP